MLLPAVRIVEAASTGVFYLSFLEEQLVEGLTFFRDPVPKVLASQWNLEFNSLD